MLSDNGAAGTCCTGVDGKLVDEKVEILYNDRVAPSIYIMQLAAPGIASGIKPGQFVHLQIPNFEGHVLRRPFSVYSWDDDRQTISIMYQVVGEGSRALTRASKGTRTMAIGPIGNGWSVPEGARKAIMVCGGLGVAPQTMLAKQMVDEGMEVHCLLGATTESRIIGKMVLDDYGVDVRVSTDDGSYGYHGFCTDLIGEYMNRTGYISICGPEPMERAAVREISRLTGGEFGAAPSTDGAAVASSAAGAPASLTCQVSLERRMACGIGACLSCVVDTVDGKKRACVDGPVFDAQEVVW